MALASNSPKESIDAKISFHDGIDLFQKPYASWTPFVIVCNNESMNYFLNLYSFSMQDGKILSLS